MILTLLLNISSVLAVSDTASSDLSFTIPTYTKIEAVTSPVLIANITDHTGNLYTPLSTKFKVITNIGEERSLYLNAFVNTDCGRENAMFEQGGQVYVAFGNVLNPPKSSSLHNCKRGGVPKDSPGVVAYPVTSVRGANARYVHGKEKYEVKVKNGVTYIDVNIGSSVLRTSFAANDPKGFYQAILSLTETDI